MRSQPAQVGRTSEPAADRTRARTNRTWQHDEMDAGLRQFLDLLDLERLDNGPLLYRGSRSNDPHIRAFGGHIAAQTLMAACRSVDPDRVVHSLHAYFLRPGRPDVETDFSVDAVRDGRSFSTRHVKAYQEGSCIFEMSASFHRREKGIEHVTEMPKVPPPEQLTRFEERFAGRDQTDMERWFVRARPFDIRYVGRTPFDVDTPFVPEKVQAGRTAANTQALRDGSRSLPRQQVWLKVIEVLPDDAALHACAVAYASDMTVLDAVLMTHGMSWTDRTILGASLDHAMWFHQPFRADEWLLFDQESPIAFGGRGLARAQIWTQDGRLIVSVVQEALLRPPGNSPVADQ